VQGGVSPAEGRGASSPSGGKIKPKAKSNPTGGRAPTTKVRSKKAADKKIKQTEVKFLNQA